MKKVKPIIMWENHEWSNLKPHEFEKTLSTPMIGAIKYFLIPISDKNPVYLVHKPKEYMHHFKKATIQFSGVITQFSTIDEKFERKYPEGFIKPLPETRMELTTVHELLVGLHSIQRILYCNKISHANNDESICYEILDFSSFQLEIELTDGETCGVEMTLTTENGMFGCREILKRIKKYYSPVWKGIGFSFDSTKWSRTESTKEDFTLLKMGMTQSVLLLSNRDLSLLNQTIYSAYCYNIMYNEECKDEISEIKERFDEHDHLPMTNTLRYNALWSHDIFTFLEYVTYLPFLYINLMTMAEAMFDAPTTFNVKTNITIACYSKGFLEVDCDVNNPLSVFDIIQYFRNMTER